ncbi:hypothetical protein AK812_SmicGene16792 [Symbiodinium microadriaticum]|uniref:Uncharacterized protein n=1 Tax=Symbiodinium microadriaticum TaxID=2951 RepID=A0A1Q9DZE2_SYMMI|nr:hypothetical protein AK812_SmicGene16792 [Symbiodinium microadriaticum]
MASTNDTIWAASGGLAPDDRMLPGWKWTTMRSSTYLLHYGFHDFCTHCWPRGDRHSHVRSDGGHSFLDAAARHEESYESCWEELIAKSSLRSNGKLSILCTCQVSLLLCKAAFWSLISFCKISRLDRTSWLHQPSFRASRKAV